MLNISTVKSYHCHQTRFCVFFQQVRADRDWPRSDGYFPAPGWSVRRYSRRGTCPTYDSRSPSCSGRKLLHMTSPYSQRNLVSQCKNKTVYVLDSITGTWYIVQWSRSILRSVYDLDSLFFLPEAKYWINNILYSTIS